jgi:hypothetical protein
MLSERYVGKESAMRQFDTFTYGVDAGETITLVAHLQGLPATATTVSKPFKRKQTEPDPTWEFEVPKEGTQEVFNAFAEVSFVGGTAAASADISVQGSNGGTFSIPTITSTSADKDPGFTFWVN